MSKVKILVVDDSTAMRRLIRRAIRQSGYVNVDVEEAENGTQALEKFQTFLPHLVLSDWNMPEMNGIELLQTLNGKYSQVNLGFITSQITQEMRIKAEQAGALFFLSKPFSTEQLKWTLEPYLQE
jgi:two-component system chemotaxis response regulator CheY